jgi:DNA adenine methylase
MTTILAKPLKWHGGKHYLAPKILGLMPVHLHYVEPFFGSGAVLFARDPDQPGLFVGEVAHLRGVSEVVNDINGRLINFWRALQDVERFEQFRRIVEVVPLARDEWEKAHQHEYGVDPVADAVAFFVDARQSRSGLMQGFTPLTRNRTRRQLNGNVSEWLGAVEGLPAVHARLRRVAIENMPAIKLIKREDTPRTLYYLDPTYMPSTRAAPDAYEFEMSEDDHRELLTVLQSVQGMVMLSGYDNPMYNTMLVGWKRHEFDVPNNAAGGAAKRRMQEVLWLNPACARASAS